MGRSARPEGKCRICGRFALLSWEHVPPESAYNEHRVVRASQAQMQTPGPWDGRRGQIEQRGSGAFTLCEPCNNNTGAWYAKEYAAWAKQGLERLARIPPNEENAFFIPFRGKPLRFLKQALTMLFSVNDEDFATAHPELVKLVLDPKARGLSPGYKLELVLVRGRFARSAGVFGTTDFATGQTEVATEIAHYPFALRMIIGDVRAPRRGAFEHFADFGLDDQRDVWLCTIAGEIATKYPGDYRNRERVEREAAVGATNEGVR